MGDMRFLIDEHTAERLVSGTVAPDDAPPGYSRLAELVRAAQLPGSSAELVGAGAVAAMASAIASNTLTPAAALASAAVPGSKRKKMISKVLTAKAASAATIALFGLGTAAAAATGALPLQGSTAPTQGTTTLQITRSSGGTSGTSDTSGTGGITGSGSISGGTVANPPAGFSNVPLTGVANIHALHGLCTALLAGSGSSGDATSTTGGKYNSTAFKALINEAGGTVASATTACGAYLLGLSGASSTGSSTGSTGAGTTTGGASTQTTGGPSGHGKSGTHSHGGGHGSGHGRP